MQFDLKPQISGTGLLVLKNNKCSALKTKDNSTFIPSVLIPKNKKKGIMLCFADGSTVVIG